MTKLLLGPLLPYLFYAIGSVAFLVGTLIVIVRIVLEAPK